MLSINIKMTIHQIFKLLIRQLEPLYGIGEANSLARRLLDDAHGIGRHDIMLRGDTELSQDVECMIKEQLSRLLKSEPLQHITGFEEFMGRHFAVNPSVLIPRPETEELIKMVIKDNHSPCSILDIGTGSGIIATTLALEIENSRVLAWDVSHEALEVAKANASALGAKVDFQQIDILNDKLPLLKFDVIVSNPPYVCNQERQYMHSNVSDYEPSLALFVPDDEPLLFYHAIERYAKLALRSEGRLYFEINERFGNEMVDLLSDFDRVALHKDIHGRNRMISCYAK